MIIAVILIVLLWLFITSLLASEGITYAWLCSILLVIIVLLIAYGAIILRNQCYNDCI